MGRKKIDNIKNVRREATAWHGRNNVITIKRQSIGDSQQMMPGSN